MKESIQSFLDSLQQETLMQVQGILNLMKKIVGMILPHLHQKKLEELEDLVKDIKQDHLILHQNRSEELEDPVQDIRQGQHTQNLQNLLVVLKREQVLKDRLVLHQNQQQVRCNQNLKA